MDGRYSRWRRSRRLCKGGLRVDDTPHVHEYLLSLHAAIVIDTFQGRSRRDGPEGRLCKLCLQIHDHKGSRLPSQLHGAPVVYRFAAF